jgi:hypothetical protein
MVRRTQFALVLTLIGMGFVMGCSGTKEQTESSNSDELSQFLAENPELNKADEGVGYKEEP